MKTMEKNYTYDEIYMGMWELSQRYPLFTTFRIIGNSHDERQIPMLEIGHGKKGVFCVTGMTGQEWKTVEFMFQLLGEYCSYYEKNWILNELYQVRELLDKIRLCVMPIVNPDGFEIVRKGYLSIRNPIYRQMLRMQELPSEEYQNNARNVWLDTDFPLDTAVDAGNASLVSLENETRALIHIFTEYESVGLLKFGQAVGNITCYKYGYTMNLMKEAHLARYLKKRTKYHLEMKRIPDRIKTPLCGNCAQFYTKETGNPSFRIELPLCTENMSDDKGTDEKVTDCCYENMRTLPLEYIFAI